jgi:uncharacterized integral membrane protein
LLTAIGLTLGGSSTVHIYTQTIHRTAQLTTLVGRLSGIRTQSSQTKISGDTQYQIQLNLIVTKTSRHMDASACVQVYRMFMLKISCKELMQAI